MPTTRRLPGIATKLHCMLVSLENRVQCGSFECSLTFLVDTVCPFPYPSEYVSIMVPGSAWCVLETIHTAATEPIQTEAALHYYLMWQCLRKKQD